MVLTLGLLKRRGTNFLKTLAFLLVLYLAANYFYLIWYIANPEGFWGLNYFWELIMAGIIVLILFALCIFLILGIVTTLYKIIIGRDNIKALLNLSGILIAVILLTGFNYLYGRGFSLYISKILSDKYSYLKKTEELLIEGDKIAALEYAKSAYEKETNRKKVSTYLFLAKLYSETNFDRKQKLISKYAALINYAHCLQTYPKFIVKSELLFASGLKLIDSDLVKDEKNNLAIFPTLSLAEIHLQKGDYDLAEVYFSNLNELNKNLDQDDIHYIITANWLFADRALRVGDVDRAMGLLTDNLNFYEKTDLNKTSSVYLGLVLQATTSELYFQNLNKATDLLLKAIPIAEKKHKKDIYANYLLVRAQYCYSAVENNYNSEEILENGWWEKITGIFTKKLSLNERLLLEAEKCIIDYTEIVKQKSSETSFKYLNGLKYLADFYGAIGKYDIAKKNYNKALAVLKPYRKTNEDLYYDLFLNSTSIGFGENINYSKLEEIEKYYYQKLADNYLFLTEDEKVSFSLNMERKFDLINSLYIREGSEKSRKNLYNNILALKNIALYSNQSIRIYLNSVDPKLKKEYQSLLNEKENFFYNKSNSKEAKLDISNKERNLIRKITSSSSYHIINPRAVQWEDIKKSLAENEVAVEILNVPAHNQGITNRQYYALLINRNSTAPAIIPLFAENELLELLNKNGNTQERINAVYQQSREKLYNLIWKRIETELNPNDKIYLSVSGLLHTVSFPALLNDKKTAAVYVESTKELITNNQDTTGRGNIVLFGNISYGKQGNLSKSQNRISIKNANFSKLPFSKNEIEEVQKLVEKNSDNNVAVFAGNSATEENFRKLNGRQFNIVHIATHGLYDKYGNNLWQMSGLQNENVLLKSGLAFANANLNLRERQNDGILNSFEISQMDLSGVDLVVLSACETGLGDIKGNEGVFGLRRAFKLAGVKTMIVSLWQVPDKSTSELMVHFYEFYLKGFSKKESLKKSQELIKIKYKSPFYWGGFVLIE